MPYGATPEDTGEFLLGDVHVNVVLLESNGQIDASTENWTPALIAETKQKVEAGVNWWKDLLAEQNSVHELNFHFDYTFADTPFQTAYEPISRISQNFSLWVGEFLDHVGFGDLGNGDAGINRGIRAFNHSQRVESDSDWSFTVFVVNSHADPDGRFAAYNQDDVNHQNPTDFTRAFAFAGGRFFVVPATRPTSAYAHEFGHMFFALDEHSGGASYTARRGYYNTQNLNGSVGHPNSSSRVTSIMDAHEPAFPIHAISPSAAEMVGWRDSDSDGIFDVLDVPLQLTGSGAVDAITGKYRFVGQAEVGVLRNLNQASLLSDVTINEVSRVQYRIDGGPWTDAVEPHAHQVDLDFSFDVPSGEHSIEIRALDDATNEPGETGVMSAVFQGSTTDPSSTARPGLNGFVWDDEDQDGVRDANEALLAGWTVEVRSAAGLPLNLVTTVEPDDHADDQNITNAYPEVKLTASGTGVSSNAVSVRADADASTGSKVFAQQTYSLSGAVWSTEWVGTQRQLYMEFSEPVTTVSIDAIANSAGDYGRLELYNANLQLIDRVTTGPLAEGQSTTMTLGRPTAEIKYAVATGHANTTVLLDRLRFGAETTFTTDANGAWHAPHLDEGDFTVRVSPPSGWQPAAAGGGSQAVSLASGETVEGVNFAFVYVGPVWHNVDLPADVDRDGVITTLDLLKVVQYLRENGIGAPEGEPDDDDPRVDVKGDGVIALSDLLIVIQALRLQIEQQGGGGEGESLAAWAVTPEGTPSGLPPAEPEVDAPALGARSTEPSFVAAEANVFFPAASAIDRRALSEEEVDLNAPPAVGPFVQLLPTAERSPGGVPGLDSQRWRGKAAQAPSLEDALEAIAGDVCIAWDATS